MHLTTGGRDRKDIRCDRTSTIAVRQPSTSWFEQKKNASGGRRGGTSTIDAPEAFMLRSRYSGSTAIQLPP